MRKPFSIALSNSLRFWELQSLRDIVADDSRYFQDEFRKLTGEEVVGKDFAVRGVIDMVRLPRVLQEKEIERLGGVKTIRVDIRIIASPTGIWKPCSHKIDSGMIFFTG